jgi:hypothetical protein
MRLNDLIYGRGAALADLYDETDGLPQLVDLSCTEGDDED